MGDRTFLHNLDAGDLIVSLASVQSLGGGVYYLKRQKPQLYGLLKQLLESQDYISQFLMHNKEVVDYDFSTFRKGGIPYGKQLGRLHSDWIGATPDWNKPWLKVEPSKEAIGKIVINRTGRYRNHYFPWRKIVAELGPHMVFVGLEQEWVEFCRMNGKVERIKTRNLYDVARAIAGSELFIGNQSSPNALCEGLKHPLIQETCLFVPDCIYPRTNAVHCFDGNLSLEFKGKRHDFTATRKRPRLVRSDCPQGGWKVMVNNKSYHAYCFKAVGTQVRMDLGPNTPANLDEMIEEYTLSGLSLEAIPQADMKHMRAIEGIIASPL